MENNRGTWGSSLGFLLAAIGSAVGFGNIWGFPYKMGKSGGVTFLVIYLILAVLVGVICVATELALGRKTGKNAVAAVQTISQKFKWAGWLGILSAIFLNGFYMVLGGYTLQYLTLNLAEVSFKLSELFGGSLSGSVTFASMLTNRFGCVVFTLLFIFVCGLIVKGGVQGGLEKFNKIGMPALAVMLVVIIIRALTLPNAVEGLKFMFVPGYAVSGGFIEKAPDIVSVLGTAGGQMFFSLSLGMGIMIAYGSYLPKTENLTRSSIVIVVADTLVALMAGIAVIPAAVANGLNSGLLPGQIKLGGPNLLFVTLQDVFSDMGQFGAFFGTIFYLLVLIAAVSSAISIAESVAAYAVDRNLAKGKSADRTKVTIIVSAIIAVLAMIVTFDGLGSNGMWVPLQDVVGVRGFNDCWLDFFDFLSEGLMMPLGELILIIMIGWEVGTKSMTEEIGGSSAFTKFYAVCTKWVAPFIMTFILAGQIQDFIGVVIPAYVVSIIAAVVCFIIAISGKKKSV